LRVKNVFNRAQNLRQRFRIQLGCSTRAVRIAGQADLSSGRMNHRHRNSFDEQFVRSGAGTNQSHYAI
jgi:hypothetical protein